MNNKKYVLNEIEAWRREELVTPEQAELLSQRYRTKQKANPLIYVLSSVGAVMAAAGLILIVATGWRQFPDWLRRAMAFLPLLTAQAAAVYALVRQKTSLAWREGLSLFYTLAVVGTLKLVEISFNVPTDYARFILLCGVMITPIFLIFRSVTACASFLFAVINWGAIYADTERYGTLNAYLCFSLMLALTVFGVVAMQRSVKISGGLIRKVADWLTAVVLFASAVVFMQMTDAYVPPVLLLMFNVLLVSGKTNDDWASPIVSAGTAGTFTMMFLLSIGAFNFDAEDRNAVTFILCALLIAALIVLTVLNARKDLRRIVVTASDVLISVFFLIGLAAVGEEEMPDIFFLPMVCVVFVCGVIYLADGIREEKLSDINIGFLTICAVLGSWLAQSEIDTFIKGIFFFLIGCAFLALNLLLQKKYRRKNVGKEASPDEIQ